MAPHDAQPIINMQGDTVALGPLCREFLDLYEQWFNDFEVKLAYSRQLLPLTHESMEAWYERVSKGESGTVQFAIYEASAMRPIGWAMLDEIDHFDQTASYGIFIGDKTAWGKGYGTETTRMMLDYGFFLLHLHNIMLSVDSYNERAIRAYRRAGFREIGRRREAKQRGNHRYDVVYMECLATEFRHARLQGLLLPSPQARVEQSRKSRAGP